ncbi:hypothetical protein ACH4C2_05180 [Streptomyces sp. NPDC018057]|uniref:hypothetical protein n=1 Tax=unclassified Streptomyces TaxID=2593676 RepID=UPI0037B8C726
MRRSALVVGTAAMALLATGAPGAQADTTPVRYTESQIATMDPVQQAEILEPLRHIQRR